MNQTLSVPHSTSLAPRGAVKAGVLVLCFIAAAAAARRIVVLLFAAGTLRAGSGNGLDVDFASRKILTLSHIVPALLLVALLTLKVFGNIGPERQRSLSKAIMFLGVIVGITALLMSLHPVGGVLEASAAISWDALFLFSLGRAWGLLRRGDETRYREWMVRAIAVLLGIATTRPVMGVFFATSRVTHLRPGQFFGIAFWIGFSVTYTAGELYLRMQQRPEARLTDLSSDRQGI